jgi:hypothetical protein
MAEKLRNTPDKIANCQPRFKLHTSWTEVKHVDCFPSKFWYCSVVYKLSTRPEGRQNMNLWTVFIKFKQVMIQKLFSLITCSSVFHPFNLINQKLRIMLQPEGDAYLIIYSASSGRVALLCLSTWYMYSSWPHDMIIFSRPQSGL